MRHKLSIAIAASVGVGIFAVIQVLAATQQQAIPQSSELASAVYWLRQLPGLVGMVLALVAGYMFFRVMRHNKTLEASESTVKIYKEQLDATNSRLAQVVDDHKRVVDQFIITQAENKELKNRTDLTEVLKLQQAMFATTKEHDAEMSTILKGAIERGQTQYAEVMTSLNKTLDYLAEQARTGSKTADQNHELLVAMSSAVGRVADKLAGVEVTVNKSHDEISDVKDTVESIANHVDPQEPEHEPEKRRRESRR